MHSLIFLGRISIGVVFAHRNDFFIASDDLQFEYMQFVRMQFDQFGGGCDVQCNVSRSRENASLQIWIQPEIICDGTHIFQQTIVVL